MSSLSDILTAAKNVVTAVNGVAQTYLNVQGTLNSSGITAAKLVKSGTGRISSVSVIVAGSADGFVYEIRNRVTLCHCGYSGNKPFCDGSHMRR